MSVQRDPDAILAAWLEEGPMRLPDATRRAVAVSTATTHQARRPIWSSWRYPFMNTYAKLAITALVVAVVGAAGLALLGSGGSGLGGQPGASQSPAPSAVPSSTTAAPTPSIPITDTSNWMPFTSTRYGYSISHPAGWTAMPADRDATATAPPTDVPDSSSDRFLDQSASYGILVTSLAKTVPAGTTLDGWLAQYYKVSTPAQQQCFDTQVTQPITIDGHPGKIVVNDPCSAAEAFVLIDGRIHEFGVWRENQSALLEAFLSTVRFQAASSPSASPSVLAAGGDVFPGRYLPVFDPPMSFTIDREVEHNCAAGYQCRGNIDGNLAGYLELEFGQPRIGVAVVRVDQVNNPSSPGKLMDPPTDLAGWIAARPGLTVVSQQAVTIGGVVGTQLDVQVGAKDVIFGPIPGVTDHQLAVGKNSLSRVIVVTVGGHAIVIIAGAEDGSVNEVQPLIDSIVWR